MPEYLFCTNHSFASVDDLKKHLQADMRDFVAIMPEMKAAGLTRAERGIRVDGKGQYIHQGLLWFRDRDAYEAGMAVLDNAKWDAKIPRKNRYETYVMSDEITSIDLENLEKLSVPER